MSIKHDIIEHAGAFKVLAINIAIMAGATLADIDLILKICASIFAISYTAWKFWSDYHKSRDDNHKSRDDNHKSRD